MTPVMHAASYNYLASLRILNTYNADFSAVDFTGASALMKAAQWGQLDSLQYLLHKCPNADQQDQHGTTVLMAAAKEDKPIILRQLLDAGAKIDVVDDKGFSALMHALQRGADACIDILLERGASVNRIALDRQTTVLTIALNASKDCGKYYLVEQLLLRGADMTVSRLDQDYLHSMIAREERSIVRLMVMNGCPPFDRRCWELWFKFSHHHMPISPLAVALLSGFYDTARYLIVNRFLTKYDMTIWPNDPGVMLKLKTGQVDDQFLVVLDYFLSGPTSLYVMSFVVISEQFNKPTGNTEAKSLRRKLIETSGLPKPLQAQLLFQTPASKLCLDSWQDLSLETSQKTEVCTCSSCGVRGGFSLVKVKH